MSDPTITLYDIASKTASQCVSPFAWRARLVLNYKQIPYRTTFVSLADLSKTLEAAGVPPTRDVDPRYTIPAVIDKRDPSNPAVIADSPLIAEYLERTYPEPRLFPTGVEDAKEQHDIEKLVFGHLMPGVAPLGIPAATKLFNERDHEYFISTRKARLGASVEELEASGTHDEKLKKLMSGLDDLANAMDERAGGADKLKERNWPFGDEKPVYADFILGATLIWIAIVIPDVWQAVKDRNGCRWAKMHKNCEPFMQVV